MKIGSIIKLVPCDINGEFLVSEGSAFQIHISQIQKIEVEKRLWFNMLIGIISAMAMGITGITFLRSEQYISGMLAFVVVYFLLIFVFLFARKKASFIEIFKVFMKDKRVFFLCAETEADVDKINKFINAVVFSSKKNENETGSEADKK